MKKISVILSIAVVHAFFTKIISIAALSVITGGAHERQLSAIGRSLMLLSKVLYFPVFTFALYPRQFFPGNLVVVPLFINSLIWALIIYVFFALIKRAMAAGELGTSVR